VEFFVVRAVEPAADAMGLNRFLASRRVLSIDRRFVECGLQSYWSICVDYLDSTIATVGGTQSKRKGIDYREVLSEADFGLYSKLRDDRKQAATADAVPVYALFTNEQLAAMVQAAPSTLQELQRIPGLGEAKLRNHGQAILALLRSCAEVDSETDR
jgi:superfamily II DNA helicase RecQ